MFANVYRIIPWLGYVLNNQADRKFPKDRLFLFQMAELHGLQTGGDPNHLLTGMIFQVYKPFFSLQG